ncbi:MAG: TlpA disulfide reductase family protein [Bacteroidota bacterium]
MKYLLMLFFFLALNNSYGQTITTRAKLDSKSIVKDATGSVYPYSIWPKLIQTGEYSIKNDKNGEFLLYRLSPEEIAVAAERKKAMILNMPKPRSSDVFKDGTKFNGSRITDINGNKFDLKNNTDKVYVINFWFINCPPCKQEIPELNELVKQYKDHKDVVFLAIALDNVSDLRGFLKTMPFNYNIVGNGQYFSQKYGVKGYPTHLIVGKDGLIKFSTVGLGANTIYWIEKTIKEQLSI